MKKILTLFAVVLISVAAMAQPAAMKFAGPAKFGVEAMDAWQDNESDTIVFKMNDATNGDVTLPAFTYNAMKLTIPSFTIHGLKFDFDATTRNATFPEQEYKETIFVDGVEKAITGYSFSGSYNAKENTFTLTAKLSYGKMPVQVTYTINAVYVKEATAIESIQATISNERSSAVYDLSGRKVSEPKRGGIYIINGKKTTK
ncbi:MAG: hypothetical protein Q4E68_05480 [Prevotellaceae bacterium]|nr:hypothetical protein [Prevotellaceae bacterium]